MDPDMVGKELDKVPFKELVDLNRLGEILEQFSRTTGFITALVSYPDQEPLLSAGWHEICRKFHRCNRKSEHECRLSNAEISGMLEGTGTVCISECRLGLINSATPIVVGGVHVASIFSGQVLFDEPDRERFRQQAIRFGYDVDEYLAALERVPRATPEMLRDATLFLGEMAGMLAELGQARFDTARVTDELKESEIRHRDYINNTPYGIFVVDEHGRYVFVNPAASAITGYSDKELLSMSIMDTQPPDGVEAAAAHFRQVVEEGQAQGELRYLHRSGQVRWWSVSAVRLSDNRFIGFCNDISDRKAAEEALARNQERFRILVHNSNDIFTIMDADGTQKYVSAQSERILGFRPDELVGTSGFALVHPDDLQAVLSVFSEGLKVPDSVRTAEYRYRHKNGSWVDLEAIGSNRLHDPSVNGIVLNVRDISARKKTENELRQSMQTSKDIVDTIPSGLIIYRFEEPDLLYLVEANPEAERLIGIELNAQKGMEFNEIWPEARARGITAKYVDAIKTGVTYETEDLWYEDERVIGAFRIRAFRLPAGRLAVAFENITERKRAEQESARLRDQLQQAMKMEAIGRLAGGVAHDFNNLLTGITGNIALALNEIDRESQVHEMLVEAGRAADSAASLTRQLLAFSRKQMIEPKVVDLNELISAMHRMLVRVIGEDVELRTVLGRQIGLVRIDPGQFEQILVNLAVNGRDAMPAGGRLLIETSAAVLDDEYCRSHPSSKPGRYVRLAVTDTGTGLSDEAREHLFEPFFTTKPMGKGTGLGLATIYGAVNQAGGNIEVYSESGHGTTFKVYFPVVEEKSARDVVPDKPGTAPCGTETVLLVEDEQIVRDLATRILRRFGYTVLLAADGQEAIRIATEHSDKIDLMMTDVVMPGMNGRQVADRMARIHPETKVLFTSGYTEDAIVHHGVVDADVNFIGKPYTPRALAEKIRSILDC